MSKTIRRKLNPEQVRGFLRMVGYIDSVRPSLGFPFGVILATRLGALWSALGRGVFVVTRRGYGKGDTLEAGSIPQLGFLLEVGEELHRDYLKKALAAGVEAGNPINRLAVLFEDLGDLHDDPKKIRATIGMASRQISQLSTAFTGFRDAMAAPHAFDSVSWACGMTPDVLERVTRFAAWRSKWGDRFSRITLIRTPQDLQAIEDYRLGERVVSKAEIRQTVDLMVSDSWPGGLPKGIRIEAPPEELKASSKLLWGSWTDDPRTRARARVGDAQHTETRRLEYLHNDLRGMAAINGRDVATMDDLVLYEMAAPLFRLGSLDPLDLWITVHAIAGSSIADVTEETKQLMDAWQVLDRARKLQRYGLVFVTISDPQEPWEGRLEPGWYWTDWLRNLAALRKLAKKSYFGG